MRALRVLIVEDNPITTDALEVYLQDHGYEIDHAGNGHGGMVRIEVAVPDVIVLDYLMPAMDGITFLHRLRSDPRFERIPVVLVTAASDHDCQEVLDAVETMSPVTVLRKPFEPRELLSVLGRIPGRIWP